MQGILFDKKNEILYNFIMSLTKTINNILTSLSPREKDIIARRFGFNGNEETLEDIAIDYNISRERIRQIQESALNKILPLIYKQKEVDQVLNNARKLLMPIGLRYESRFFYLVKNTLKFENQDLKVFKFLVVYSQKIIFHESDKMFNDFYAAGDKFYQLGKHLLQKIHNHFLQTKNIYSESEILDLALKELRKHFKINPDFNDLIDFLKILKPLGKNPFNFWGLREHNLITPRCLRDKIYLLFKLENKPLHFQEIYQKLDQLAQAEDDLIHYFWHRKYNLNSIKNELINHPDFVLVGRGVYGLREWRLVEGTAKDLILGFLKTRKKISKEELWQKISELRSIKKSTFNIYLKEIKNLKQENNYLIYNG